MYRKFLLGLLLVPLTALSLESDYQQPIHVHADHAEMDRQQGLSTYRGQVTLEQGSLHISADVLRVHHAGDTLQRIEAEGSPLQFRQRPEGATEDVRGSALQLDYDARENRLILRHQARVEQGGDHFSGEHITYDMINSRVRADSLGEQDGRIHAIIQPRTREKSLP